MVDDPLRRRLPSLPTLLLWLGNVLVATIVAFAIQACYTGGGDGPIIYPPAPPFPPQNPSQWNETVQASPPSITPRIATAPGTTPAPSTAQHSTFRADFADLPLDAQVNYEWTPPLPNVAGLSFTGLQPDNPYGPPPYRFSNVPRQAKAQAFAPVNANYTWPPLPDGTTSVQGVEIFRTVSRSSTVGTPTPVQIYYTLTAAPGKTAKEGRPAATQIRRKTQPAADVPYLTFHRWIEADFEMNPDLCQAYADSLKAGQMILAVQVPAIPAADGSSDVYLPVPTHAATLRPYVTMLINQYPDPIIGFASELQPAASVMASLENTLPAKAGHHWFALTGTPELAIGNCAVFPVTSGWSVQLDMAFDALPVNGQTLTSYYCFREENPLLFEALAKVVTGLGGEVRKADADPLCCLTCLGPIPLPLTNIMTRFEIENTWADFKVQPKGARVAFHHRLRNAAGATALSWAFEAGSLQGLNWGLYADAGGTYDLNAPLTQITGSTSIEGTPFWIVSEPVTQSIPVGTYAVRITGNSPTSTPTTVYTTDTAYVLPLLGDLNLDGAVNAADYALLAGHLAANRLLTGRPLFAADLDLNGIVDVRDLAVLVRQTSK